MRSVLSTVEDMVFSMALPSYSFLYLNPATEKIFGRPVQEFIDNGQVWLDCVHPEDRQRMTETQQHAIEAGTSESQFRILRKDGTLRHVTARIWAAYGPHGAPLRLEGIVMDVTDRRRAEEERIELELSRREAERLGHLNEFKSQFIGMVAHDLNNVVTPMRLNLDLVKEQVAAGAPADPKALTRLSGNIERIGEFLADLLDASRLQSGQLVLEPGPFDLAEALAVTVDALRPQAEAAAIRLELSAPEHLPLLADRHRLGQVSTNLLSNALKFTPKGGRVQVALRVMPDGIRLSVSDNGPGVASEDIPKLFQPFSRLHATPQGRHTGTGLGLYISRGIVEQHGGRIWCESPGLGKGASFFVSLPADAPQHAAGKAPAPEAPNRSARLPAA